MDRLGTLGLAVIGDFLLTESKKDLVCCMTRMMQAIAIEIMSEETLAEGRS